MTELAKEATKNNICPLLAAATQELIHEFGLSVVEDISDKNLLV